MLRRTFKSVFLSKTDNEEFSGRGSVDFGSNNDEETTPAVVQIGEPENIVHVGTQDPQQAAILIMKMLYGGKFMHHNEVNSQNHSEESLLSTDVRLLGRNQKTEQQKSGNVSNRNTEAPKAHQRSETEFNNLSNQVKDRTKPANNRCYTHVQTTDNEPKKLANGETKSPIVEKKKKTQTQGASQWMSEDEMVVHLRDLVGIGDGESRFVTRDLIGHGASAAVYSCTDTTNGKTVAMKILQLREQRKKEYVVSEIRVMRRIHHPNIVNLIDCFLSPDRKELKIVMEFLWKSLTLVITTLQAKMEEQFIAYTSYETLQGLEYLHDNQIIHRDIKSDNVLVGSNGEVKIADFGFCAELWQMDDNRETQLGTPYWMSPEIARGEKYTTKVDIWSMGILMIELIDTSPPFMEDETFSKQPLLAIQEIGQLREPPEIVRHDQITDELNNLVRSCLTIDPKDRPDATSILQHPFLDMRCTQGEYAMYLSQLDWSSDNRS
ncbi:serine/threonine-protein kinase PAK 2-like [Convolutriloba macropyga]|uniref:serine/threonine-protein kinase PAK 2-like n=1 Tax=Convolutriloba macropyga TaxID=536237 RepID=UPI003F525F47